MTGDGVMGRRPIEGKTAGVRTFQRKFEGTSSRYSGYGSGKATQSGTVKAEPGYMQKVRAKAHRLGYGAKKTVSAAVLPTGKKIDDLANGRSQERLTYKVRRGELTVTNQDGEVVMQSDERGLENYDGLTLEGEVNKQGKMELNGGMAARQVLAKGNGVMTPREVQEQKQDRQMDKVVEGKRMGKKVGRAVKRAGETVKQGGLAMRRRLGR